MALRLKRRGIQRVRPLEGGYARWVEEGYPLEPWVPAAPPGATPAAVGG